MNYEVVKEIYFSPSGTTKTVIDRISVGFTQQKEVLDLLKKPLQEPLTLSETTALIIGVPVFAGRIPAVCAEQLKLLKGTNTPAVAVVVYGNRDYDDALLELTNLLTENGFAIIAAAAFVAEHSIFPVVATGRPDEKDLLLIDDFSSKCDKALKEFSGAPSKVFNIKGSVPYKKPAPIPLKPTGNSSCTGCGACAKICPVHAIDAKKPKATKMAVCISCTACIKICPKSARSFRTPIYSVARNTFAKSFSERREPEIFI